MDEDERTANMKLRARVNRSAARTIGHALAQLSGKGSLRKAGDEFVVEAEREPELQLTLAAFIL